VKTSASGGLDARRPAAPPRSTRRLADKSRTVIEGQGRRSLNEETLKRDDEISRWSNLVRLPTRMGACHRRQANDVNGLGKKSRSREVFANSHHAGRTREDLGWSHGPRATSGPNLLLLAIGLPALALAARFCTRLLGSHPALSAAAARAAFGIRATSAATATARCRGNSADANGFDVAVRATAGKMRNASD
jgi:hypothetical protein